MDKSIRFRRSIQHIEEHLHDSIDLGQAAQAGFTSLMQLYRDFYTYTGHSVKEYIRKRRLSTALSLIKCSDLPFAEIAYSCGYSSQQALCKGVKSATAMTPLEYRKSEAYYYFPRFDTDAVRQVTVMQENIPKAIWAKFYHPKLNGIEHQALCVLKELLPEYQGRIFGKNGQQLGSRFCYEISVEYDPDVLNKLRNSVFVEVNVLPGTSLTFAKTTVKDDEQEIGLAWNYLYHSWLKTSMFTQDNESYFEEYIQKDGAVKKLILYMPVTRRKDYNKISLVNCESMLFLVSSREGLQAEEEASQEVMSYLSKHNPGAIRSARQFYVTRAGGSCTCGIRVEQELELPQDSGLACLRHEEGCYAVIESDSCSDSRVFEAYLDTWISESGFKRGAQPAFSIYETDGTFEPEAIKTKVWIKLENVKNG